MKYEVELTDEQARAHEHDHPANYAAAYGSSAIPPGMQARIALADAVRANPPKPARMAEPGWGEKVIAVGQETRERGREEWLRVVDAVNAVGPCQWVNRDTFWASWDQLIDPEPVDS